MKTLLNLLFVLALIPCLGLLVPNSAGAGEKWAITIGINDYERAADIPQLKFCFNDASAIENAFKRGCGFEKVILFSDKKPGLSELQAHNSVRATDLIEDLKHWVDLASERCSDRDPDNDVDLLAVFFSGHGFRDDEDATHLVAINTLFSRFNGQLRDTIPLKTLRNLLVSCTVRQKLLILDCCHAGGKGVRAVGVRKNDEEKSTFTTEELRDELERSATASGLITMASCSGEQLSRESPEYKLGYFTKHLADALDGRADDRNSDRILGVRDIFEYVKLRVEKENVGQSPELIIDESVGAGDFGLRAADQVIEVESRLKSIEFEVFADSQRTIPLENAIVRVAYRFGGISPGNRLLKHIISSNEEALDRFLANHFLAKYGKPLGDGETFGKSTAIGLTDKQGRCKIFFELPPDLPEDGEFIAELEFEAERAQRPIQGVGNGGLQRMVFKINQDYLELVKARRATGTQKPFAPVRSISLGQTSMPQPIEGMPFSFHVVSSDDTPLNNVECRVVGQKGLAPRVRSERGKFAYTSISLGQVFSGPLTVNVSAIDKDGRLLMTSRTWSPIVRRRVVKSLKNELGMIFIPRTAPNGTLQSPFLISENEITVGQFRQFQDESRYQTYTEEKGYGYGFNAEGKRRVTRGANWDSPGIPQGESHPVSIVNWNDANAFAQWLSRKTGQEYRLPSLDEWVYVASEGRPYSNRALPLSFTDTANVFDSAAASRYAARVSLYEKNPLAVRLIHNSNDQYVYSAPVGSFQPNSFGVYDLFGNLEEWTLSSVKGQPHLRHVVGGSFYSSPANCNFDTSEHAELSQALPERGFRLVSNFSFEHALTSELTFQPKPVRVGKDGLPVDVRELTQALDYADTRGQKVCKTFQSLAEMRSVRPEAIDKVRCHPVDTAWTADIVKATERAGLIRLEIVSWQSETNSQRNRLGFVPKTVRVGRTGNILNYEELYAAIQYAGETGGVNMCSIFKNLPAMQDFPKELKASIGCWPKRGHWTLDILQDLSSEGVLSIRFE